MTQSVDDIAESQEGSVDVLTFSETDAFGLGFACSLGSCQIDEIQLRDFGLVTSRFLGGIAILVQVLALPRSDVDPEDGVTSGTMLVQPGGCDAS